MAAVKDFGAAGDGAADDTDALQQAADDGAPLELGSGTFRITKPIVLDTTKHGYTAVHGAHGTSRIVMAGPGPALQVVGDHRGTADPASFEQHTWDRERFPLLSGFEVLGDHEQADGIQLLRTMQCTIRNVLVRKCRYGIHLVERNRNFILADTHIYDCADTGLFLDHVSLHQTNIYGNHISYCKRAGIRQLNGDVHNIQITGNDIEYNFGWPEGNSGEILLEVPESGLISEYTIASNTIQAKPEARGANLFIQGRALQDIPYCISEVAVTGNVIGSRDQSIFIADGALQVAITGNTIYGGSASNVHVRNSTGVLIGSNGILPMGRIAYRSKPKGGIWLENCADCLINGNIINDHAFGDQHRGGSVTLDRCRDVTLTGCQIHRPTSRGVYINHGVRCVVSQNTITDARDATTMLAAIEVAGASQSNVIQHNTLTTGTRSAVVCHESHGVVVNNLVL